MVGEALVNISKIFCHENPCSLLGFVIIWLRSSKTDFIQIPCSVVAKTRHTSLSVHCMPLKKAEQQEEIRTEAFLVLVGISFGG